MLHRAVFKTTMNPYFVDFDNFEIWVSFNLASIQFTFPDPDPKKWELFAYPANMTYFLSCAPTRLPSGRMYFLPTYFLFAYTWCCFFLHTSLLTAVDMFQHSKTNILEGRTHLKQEEHSSSRQCGCRVAG